MKEILIRRDQETFNKSVSYKVIFEDGQVISLDNGETRKAIIHKVPCTVYAKLNWLRSKTIVIDETTTELILKAEKIKNWFTPRVFGFVILITFLPRLIWDKAPFVKPLTIIGLSILLIWTVYALIMKSNDWILIEKR
jgi:DNA-directed RNA polymerase subunit H (RpoH/RPB5)